MSQCACTMDYVDDDRDAVGSWELGVGLRWFDRIGVCVCPSVRWYEKTRFCSKSLWTGASLVWVFSSHSHELSPILTFMSEMGRVSPSSALHHSAYLTLPILFSPSHRASLLLHLEKMRVGVVGCPHLALRDSAADSSI